MPKKRFSAEQIVTLLRQIEVSMAQGNPTPVACRDAGINTPNGPSMPDHLESTRGAIVVGDGKFSVHAVGPSAYQGPIESLVGGKTPMKYGIEPGHERALFAALLLPDPDDLYDKNAVRVIIREISVGYS